MEKTNPIYFYNLCIEQFFNIRGICYFNMYKNIPHRENINWNKILLHVLFTNLQYVLNYSNITIVHNPKYFLVKYYFNR